MNAYIAFSRCRAWRIEPGQFGKRGGRRLALLGPGVPGDGSMHVLATAASMSQLKEVAWSKYRIPRNGWFETSSPRASAEEEF